MITPKREAQAIDWGALGNWGCVAADVGGAKLRRVWARVRAQTAAGAAKAYPARILVHQASSLNISYLEKCFCRSMLMLCL